MIEARTIGVAAALWLSAAGAQAEGAAGELVLVLTERCLPLVTKGAFSDADLSEVPSFLASNFFEMLGVRGPMYQLTPEGDARFVVPDDRSACVAYQQVADIGDVLAGLEAWRLDAGLDGALPDPAQGGAEGVLTADGVSIAVTWLDSRGYLILRVSDGG